MESPKTNIQSLPPEVLSHIMHLTIEDQRDVRDHSAFPSFKLALVCREWRELALSDNDMWKEIFFDFSKQTRPEADTTQMLEEYMRRAGNATLTVVVDTSGPIDRQHPNLPSHDHSVLRKLAEYSSQWEVAVLRVRPETVISGGAFYQLYLPNLQSLTILNDGGFGLDFLSPESGFHHSPKLVYASLQGNIPPPISWTAIETLILDWYLPSDVYITLRLLPPAVRRLEVNNIFFYTGQSFRTSQMPEFTIPGVQVLRFGQDDLGQEDDHVDYEMLEALFSKAAFPNVRDLSADMQPNRRLPFSQPWPIAAFGVMVGHCASSLTTLHLRRFNSSSIDIIAVLRQARNLQVLHLESEPHSNESATVIMEVLEGMLWDPSLDMERLVIPALQNFHIALWRPRAADVFRALFAFLASRRIQIQGLMLLSHLYVVFPRTEIGEGVTKVSELGEVTFTPFVYAHWVHDRFRELMDAGLKVVCDEIWS